MSKFKLILIELGAALGLLGLVHLYLRIQRDSGIVNAPYVKTVLVVIYLIGAGAAQALTASELRETRSRVIGLNLILAIALSTLWVTGAESWKFVTVLVIATITFRLLVAVASIRTSPQKVRRFLSALVGSALLFVGLGLAYASGDYWYENYLLLPKIKAGFVMPTRWQDFTFLLISSISSAALVLTSYRLLKYAFQPKPIPSGGLSNQRAA